MDGLKRSLEQAIKEMQEMPAPVGATTVETPQARPENGQQRGQYAETNIAPAPVVHVPAANSIEAALSSAPSVSPHYIPPEPPAAVKEPEPPIAGPVVPSKPDTGAVSASLILAKKPKILDRIPPAVPQPASLLAQIKPPVRAHPPMPDQKKQQASFQPRSPAVSRALDVPRQKPKIDLPAAPSQAKEKIADLVGDGAAQATNIWRWATIGISCAGGAGKRLAWIKYFGSARRIVCQHDTGSYWQSFKWYRIKCTSRFDDDRQRRAAGPVGK